METPFKLNSFESMRSEYKEYLGKEIGLDSNRGIFYGVIIFEDTKEVHLNPHIAYNPLPLVNGETIENAEKRNSIKKIPKNILTKLVHEYPEGYIENLVKMMKLKDDYKLNQFSNIQK